MKIFINGKIQVINASPISLHNLLIILGYNPKSIVVEYNGKILSPTHWKNQDVKDEDSLEIVTIVGGGN